MSMRIYSLLLGKQPRIRWELLLAVAVVIAGVPAFASSARTIHPQLVGVKAVVLNFSPQNLPGLDADALERDIRNVLEKAKITVQETAPVTLFVRVTYQQLPACPEFVAFRTYLALSEDVVVHRGKRSETVYVDTWREGEDFLEPTIILAAAVVISVAAVGPRRPAAGSPEHIADALLRELRPGDFESAFARVPSGGMNRETAGREGMYRLRWWWLVQKRQSVDHIDLEYHTLRGWLPLPSRVWIKMAKREGEWRVTDFEAAYWSVMRPCSWHTGVSREQRQCR